MSIPRRPTLLTSADKLVYVLLLCLTDAKSMTAEADTPRLVELSNEFVAVSHVRSDPTNNSVSTEKDMEMELLSMPRCGLPDTMSVSALINDSPFTTARR